MTLYNIKCYAVNQSFQNEIDINQSLDTDIYLSILGVC